MNETVTILYGVGSGADSHLRIPLVAYPNKAAAKQDLHNKGITNSDNDNTETYDSYRGEDLFIFLSDLESKGVWDHEIQNFLFIGANYYDRVINLLYLELEDMKFGEALSIPALIRVEENRNPS